MSAASLLVLAAATASAAVLVSIVAIDVLAAASVSPNVRRVSKCFFAAAVFAVLWTFYPGDYDSTGTLYSTRSIPQMQSRPAKASSMFAFSNASLIAEDSVLLQLPEDVIQSLAPVPLTIGIPTVPRAGADAVKYLLATLSTILRPEDVPGGAAPGANQPDLGQLRILIYNGAAHDAEHVRRVNMYLVVAFPDLVYNRTIVIVPPPAENDNIVHDWHVEQNLDIAHLMAWSARLSAAIERRRHPINVKEHFMLVDDDVYAARDWWPDLNLWMAQHFTPLTSTQPVAPVSSEIIAPIDRDWLLLSLFSPDVTDAMGTAEYAPDASTIGLLFAMDNVAAVASYIFALRHGGSTAKLIGDLFRQSRQGRRDGSYGGYLRVPSLFQHMGRVSSRPGVLKPISAPQFKDDERRLPLPRVYQKIVFGDEWAYLSP